MPDESINSISELISDEVQEIVSYQPHWFIRKGNFIFFIILAGMLSLSFIIKYPDVVKASAHIVAVNAPKMLNAKTEGKLEKLLAAEGTEVKNGQQLAWLQSTADHEQVIKLREWIYKIEPRITEGQLEALFTDNLPQFTKLGEIQPFYQEFQNELRETLQILSGGYYQQKRNALRQDIQYLQMLKKNMEKQKALQEKDYVLQKTEHDAKEKLADEKVIAPLEFNQDKSKLIGKEQNIEQMLAQLINSDVSTHNKKKELLELQKFIIDQRQKFQSSLLNLKSRVEEWMLRYVVLASEDGKLGFSSFLQENQLIANGQELFFIQPEGADYYAEMRTGQNGFGKIREGQKVLIRLESYPSAEFGYLPGKISYIAGMPNKRDSFLVKVDLPQKLKTNYNKTIYFRNHLSASAEVITDDRLLAERFFNQLKQIWER